MATALVIHHDANSSLGLLADPLRAEGFELHEHFVCTELDSPVAAGPLPSLDAVDLVVVLGSRWSVYDRASIGGWVDDELDLLRAVDERQIPVFGICFGAQMLAAAHGAIVEPSRQFEIGWSHVGINDDARFIDGPWFQWHLDRFDVPAGATELARNEIGPQAFRIRRNLGVQFHPEVDESVLAEWLITDRDQLADCGIDPDVLLRETAERTARTRPQTAALLRWFLSDVATA